MPQIDLGKLRFDWKGTWSNSATYELNDVVQYTDGATNVYVALGNVVAGTLPTDTNSWALMLAGLDLSNYDTSSEVDTKIAGLVDSAPETLDTLNELAAALGDDANFATTVTNALASKLDAATYNTNAAPSTIYNVVNNGSTAYTIDGTDNPTLSLMRGQKYVFDVNASGHPFHIQTAAGAYDVNSLYTDGVTGQGTETGQVVIVVPLDAPSTLYYVCQFHSGMQGQINVADLDDKAPLVQHYFQLLIVYQHLYLVNLKYQYLM